MASGGIDWSAMSHIGEMTAQFAADAQRDEQQKKNLADSTYL